jgi:hypothetical protein
VSFRRLFDNTITCFKRQGVGLGFVRSEKNVGEVIALEGWKGQAVIRQQIALNRRMYETGRISRCLHDAAYKILLERLIKVSACDIISLSEMI